jgi:hypothetical protein
MRNKSGKAELGTIIVILLIAGIAAYAFDFGGFKGWVNGLGGTTGSSNQGGTGGETNLLTANCPSTGTTTLTLFTPDKLATTATTVVTEYYVYDGDHLYTSGTNSAAAGTAIDLTCGKDYTIQLLNSTAGTGAYGQTVTVQARNKGQSLTVPMVQEGGASILSIQNPGDPSRLANVTLVAGGTKNFVVTFSANTTSKGYNMPVILCQGNVSSIQSISIASFSDGTPVQSIALPKRISATANYQYYAFEYPKMLDPTVGVISASGSITATSTTPAINDKMSCILVDQATWKNSNYQSLSLANGFATGTENTQTSTDVGAPDAPASNYLFDARGY